jgi:superfamily II DNA/RNA helicase
MIATDAAREGINLQFAHIMIDYELPWNPNRIEQRMGRLHRYGQNKIVQIFNLLVSNTREGEIFEKLMEKLELIRSEMGERVFDVLGILLSNTPLQDLIMKALIKRDVKEVYNVVDKNIEENRRSLLEKIETKSLIRDRLNLAPLIEQQTTSREKSLDEKDMERFIRIFFDHFGGKIKKSKEGIFSLEVPRIIADNETINTKYPTITFSRETAKDLGKYNIEFVAIGHPIIDRIIRLSKEPTFGGKVTVKIDPSNHLGTIFNYLMRNIDGNGKTVNERLCTLFVNSENEDITEVDPKITWNLKILQINSTVKQWSA